MCARIWLSSSSLSRSSLSVLNADVSVIDPDADIEPDPDVYRSTQLAYDDCYNEEVYIELNVDLFCGYACDIDWNK